MKRSHPPSPQSDPKKSQNSSATSQEKNLEIPSRRDNEENTQPGSVISYNDPQEHNLQMLMQQNEPRGLSITPRESEPSSSQIVMRQNEPRGSSFTENEPQLDNSPMVTEQDRQASPGYAYEPSGVNRRSLPVQLQLLSGQTYKVRGLFGEGTFCTVYRVRDKNGLHLAAKVLKLRNNAYPVECELNAFQKISTHPHDNLLSLHYLGILASPRALHKSEVLITPACGPSIEHILSEASREYTHMTEPRFDMSNIKIIGRQIGLAMRHLEHLQIFHLDLKTANIVFTSDVTYAVEQNPIHPVITMSYIHVKVIDYGNSLNHTYPGFEQPFAIVQSLHVRAPEIIMGIRHSAKSDVWSMACIMTEMYTGKDLFTWIQGLDAQQLQQLHFVKLVSFIDDTIPQEMIDESQRGRRSSVNLDFINREPDGTEYSLMNLMREEDDFPLFGLLNFMFVFDPIRRPSFEDVINHNFFADA
ncbi:hypothetical protein L3Y34_013789 [Caenorhabditis briggsae]|uniref:Protein kinase domain-containing protein n=1 Tax=Caenorhabditis briggsae TaxID=6238 RepID=A0AAE8ZUU7_CAEBR|nr:hypothetical protein L3Y34_013789 [Caenorhabditis briggsae]